MSPNRHAHRHAMPRAACLSRALSLAALLGCTAAQATTTTYTEAESLTGVRNPMPSAEWVGALAPGDSVIINGSRRVEVGVPDFGGGSTADFFRFQLPFSTSVTLTLAVPDADDRPVLGLFSRVGSGPGSRVLLNAAYDDGLGASPALSFANSLSAGYYYAAVSGFRSSWDDFDGGGDSGWTYRLTLHVPEPTSPVPESPTVLLMLAGLGVVALKGRRRQSPR